MDDPFEVERKYRQYVYNSAVKNCKRTGVDFDTCEAYALEGLMALAGFIPGCGSNHGKLEEIADKPSWIQRAIDLHTSMSLTHDLEALRAIKRGGGLKPLSLDAPNDKGQTIDVPRPDDFTDLLDNGQRDYPILWLTKVQGLTATQVRETLGYGHADYLRAKASELARLTAHASANRLLTAEVPAPKVTLPNGRTVFTSDAARREAKRQRDRKHARAKRAAKRGPTASLVIVDELC